MLTLTLLVGGVLSGSGVRGHIGFQPGQMYAAEQEESMTLVARLNYGLYEAPVVGRQFQFSEVEDGKYLLDVGSRFNHYERAVVDVRQGVVSHRVLNPLTRKFNFNQTGERLVLNFLGKAQVYQPQSSLFDKAKGLIFSFPGLMIGMFLLMFLCKNVTADLEEAAQPAPPEPSQQQVRRKRQ